MRIEYLAERPAAAAFIAGPGKPAGAEETRGTVVVRTAFDLVAEGGGHRMEPSGNPTQHEVIFASTDAALPAPADPISAAVHGYEGDIALEKSHADVVVLGYAGDQRGIGDGDLIALSGSVTIDGAVWLNRVQTTFQDDDAPDILANLFGWQQRSEPARQISDVTTGDNLLPDAYTPHFNNVHRRSAGFTVGFGSSSALPAGGDVVISRDLNGTAGSYSLTLPDPLSLQARYFTYCGHGTDKLPFWNPGAPFDLIPDTLIVDPDEDTAVILWRGGWRFTDQPADLYRTLQIVEGGF